MNEEIRLTLHPDDLRIGTMVLLENGKVYEIGACEDDGLKRKLKAKPSDGEVADMNVSFRDEVRSYGELYTVASVDMVGWSPNPRITLEKVTS